MQFLRQSTDSQSVKLGPFVDDSDGKTAETALSITASDIKLSQNGGTFAAKNSGGGTHDSDGWYDATFDATDTDTVGRLQVQVAVSGALPVFAEFQVVEETVYDRLFAASAAGFSTHTAADVWTNSDRELTALGFTFSTSDFAAHSLNGAGNWNTETPPTAAAIATSVDTTLSSTHGAGAWTASASGSGARTITVTVDDGTAAVENATVRYTEGVNTFTASTNASGQTTLNVDDATYTVAITKAGYTFAGTSHTVSGDASPTYSVTQVTPSASSPGFTTGYLTTYDELGAVESGVTVKARLTASPASDTGIAYDRKTRTTTSNGAGLVEFTNMVLGATYSVWRSGGTLTTVTIPSDAGASYELPSIVGQ